MRNFLTAISLLLFTTGSYSQELSQVTFSNGGNLEFISFLTDQNVLIRINSDGKVLEWGTEVMSIRSNYYDPKLQPFMGRIDYYEPDSDTAYKGKVRSIGSCELTYYGSTEADTRIGKVRSVGSIILDYYDLFGDKMTKGKLSMVGSLELDYYSSFDDEAFKGKLKSIGGTDITYYSTFDDKYIRGKIKSIGSVPYEWYTSLDLKSGLKSGMYRQNIGGITFILR